MLPLLILAFIAIPIVELAVILRVGAWLGWWPTLVVLMVDSVLGAVLVKHEGRRAWDAFRNAIAEARWPGDEVAQGAFVLVGGALLLTPGFLTDVVGLLAVLAPTRAVLSRWLRRRLTPEPLRRTPHRDRTERTGRTNRPPIDVEVVSVERPDDGSSSRDASGEPTP
ncbi:MAG: FxsA family protein [Actinobacteria bacterium]|nr:FxsA family protein [Actinomycetota bacterium]